MTWRASSARPWLAAPQPPALASRSKDILNLRWKLPDDDGGRAVSEFQMACSPPPDSGARLLIMEERDSIDEGGKPGSGDGAEWAVVYEGAADIRLRLAGLSPGVR
jgi:hypothetical protein